MFLISYTIKNYESLEYKLSSNIYKVELFKNHYTSGYSGTIISSQTLQNIDAIKTYFENRIQSELLALLQNTEENFMYNKE